MNDIIIYTNGLAYCSVCAKDTISIKEIEDYVNTENPTGINSKWKMSTEKTFSDGKTSNPCPCNQSLNRIHYLLSC